MNTSEEMLRDALYLAIQNITISANFDIPSASWTGSSSSSPVKEQFSVSWRPEADRVIILFSDEEPQSFLRPEINDAVVIDSLRGSIDLKFYALVDRGMDGDRWDDIVAAGFGSRFNLTSNAVEMYNDLMSIIDEACLPRGEQASLNYSNNYKLASFPFRFYDYERLTCF